jgi:hypothetical protein
MVLSSCSLFSIDPTQVMDIFSYPLLIHRIDTKAPLFRERILYYSPLFSVHNSTFSSLWLES